MLGPQGYEKQWNSTARKAIDTAKRWAALHAGFFYNILACNIYIIPLFSYIGQLAKAGKEVQLIMDQVIRIMFTGSGNWIPKDFLSSLQVFGFPVQLRDLASQISASKVRVAHNIGVDLDEIATQTCLHVLQHARQHGDDHIHHEWHSKAFGINLVLHRNAFQEEFADDEDSYATILKRASEDYKAQQSKIVRMLDGKAFPNKKAQLLSNSGKGLKDSSSKP